MPKLKVTITGDRVHNVAYRPFLLSVAEGFDINHFFADNVKREGKEIVEALVEGDAEKIERFKEFVSNHFPENASVDDVAFSDYDGPVMGVESFYRYLTASQLSKIGTYGGMMLEKQGEMLGKQAETIEVIKAESQKTRDELSSVIKDEGEKTRDTLSKHLTDDIADLRQEIADIKATLAKVLQKVKA